MSRPRALIGAAAALAVALPAAATDGYFAHGYGTEHKSLAGAGAALSLSTLTPATNPAGLAFLGKRLDVGLAVFNPNREFTVSGSPSGFPGTFGLAPGRVESGSRFFPVPSLGASFELSENDYVGVAIYGNGGMNTSYDAPVFGAGPAGVDLSQLFLAPSYARKLGGRHALGVSPILALQRFEARGLAAFGGFSTDPARLSDNEHDTSLGAGFRLGYQGRLTDYLAVGASYQSPIWMQEFALYSGLFAQHGAFDIPWNWTVGVAVTPVDPLTLVFDVQQIHYDNVAAVGEPMLPNLMRSPLGGEGAAGFGWREVTVYKGGVQWRASDDWTLRGGYSYCRQPIPPSEVLLNILAPGVMEQHATIGVTRSLGRGRAFNLAVTRAFPKSVDGPNPMEVPGGQTIELQMDQWELDISYSFGF